MSPEPATGAELVVDASVAVKWTLPAWIEPDADLARDLIGRRDLTTTTLAHYEIANTIGRVHPARSAAAIESCALLRAICGEPLDLTPDDVALAARLAEQHGITFYDASYAAVASRRELGLVSADQHLLGPGLAMSLTDALAGRR